MSRDSEDDWPENRPGYQTAVLRQALGMVGSLIEARKAARLAREAQEAAQARDASDPQGNTQEAAQLVVTGRVPEVPSWPVRQPDGVSGWRGDVRGKPAREPRCQGCGKPAVYQAGRFLLCVRCYGY